MAAGYRLFYIGLDVFPYAGLFYVVERESRNPIAFWKMGGRRAISKFSKITEDIFAGRHSAAMFFINRRPCPATMRMKMSPALIWAAVYLDLWRWNYLVLKFDVSSPETA